MRKGKMFFSRKTWACIPRPRPRPRPRRGDPGVRVSRARIITRTYGTTFTTSRGALWSLPGPGTSTEFAPRLKAQCGVPMRWAHFLTAIQLSTAASGCHSFQQSRRLSISASIVLHWFMELTVRSTRNPSTSYVREVGSTLLSKRSNDISGPLLRHQI